MQNKIYAVRKSLWLNRWHVYFVGKLEATRNSPDVWLATFKSEQLAIEWLQSRPDVLMPF